MTVHLRYCLQQAALWGTFGLVLPIVTLFLLHNHFTLFEIGLYAALFSLSTIALELPFGAMADRVGRLRTYRVSLLMNSVGCALMLGFSQKPMLYLAAASFGVARAMISGTVDAWYVGLLREHGETKRIPYFLGRAELASALGLASMSLVGGVLPDLIGSRLFDNPYKIGLALACCLFIVLLRLTSWFFAEAEQAPHEAAPTGRMHDDLRELVRFAWHGGAVRPLILLCMLLGGVVSVLESYWPVVLKTLVPTHGATWAFGLFLTLMLVVKGAGGWASYRVMRHCAARPALAVSLVLTLWANHVVAFGVVLSGVALFLGIAGAVVNAVLHHRTPDALRSRAVSFFSLVFQLGSMIASILLGYLVGQWGVQAVWCGVGVLVAAAAGYGASIGGWASGPVEEAKAAARV
ncbi:TPA: MFS transporter [Burkholderia vietnamiensis]|uniref:MFS transporter n=1 Tax=Burkholderia vietnamiensis TaxID=60552 RepID=A0AA44XX12_BURVI|nr:MFS transporter [Burkholderia vietnamiensis]KVS05865.1 MFS transporter [Burkholderia vietnamiensis]MCA8211970.1 MFS transporter [Burkholderia vietnamiensis]PRH40158.1 MFS transporter [Burkholderia vietnamiensis]HDR9102646.1 MFS transporter [Burkholderia vietnamiensis]HDR9122465.1 MFS transporter [Burkholderia vietnamiensis]